MNVSVSHTFDKSTEIVKADTFDINDSIVLQVNIQPTKSIKMQSYRWFLDGSPYKSDFSFKDKIAKPGHHTLTFEMKDYYGDIHRDSLEIWVAARPVLDDSLYLPADGTQEVSTLGGLSFAWSAHTDSIDLHHYYRFILMEQGYSNTEMKFKVIDTILQEPTFTLYERLPPLREFLWTVQACNEYSLCSEEKISSHFFTGSNYQEGGLQGSFTTSQEQALPIIFKLTPLSDDNHIQADIYKFNISEILGNFSFSPVPAGKYRVDYESSYSDFGKGSFEVKINPGTVTELDPIFINDTIPPVISSMDGSDTVFYEDSLKFIIKDGGFPLSTQKISLHIEDRALIGKSLEGDTLTVHLSNEDKFWNYQPLVIKATDASGNTATKTFYLTPGELWFSSNSDTTLYMGDSLLIFFSNRNPYGFEVDSFWIDNFTEFYSLILINDNSQEKESTFIFVPPCEKPSTQEFISTIIYTNGIRQTKKWKIKFLEKEE